MRAKVSNIINAVTLIALGIAFLSFCWSGRIDHYLNPLFRPAVLVGGLVAVVFGITRLLILSPQQCCSEEGCDHHHASSLSHTLASFGMIGVSLMAGTTFSKDAFDQQIYENRGGSTEDDSSLSDPYASKVGTLAGAIDRFQSKNSVPVTRSANRRLCRGPVGQEIQPLRLMIASLWKLPIFCEPSR